MIMEIINNCNCANHVIPGKKEAKGVVYIVVKSEEHCDDVVTVFFDIEDAKKYCGDDENLYINISNVF